MSSDDRHLMLEERLEMVVEWAGYHPNFDDSFVLSLYTQFKEEGFLTDKQEVALENIIKKWQIEEWASEHI